MASSNGSPPLGAHMSIAGGVENAPFHGQRVGCNVIQIFTKNSNQWNAKSFTEKEAYAFHEAIQKTKVEVPLAHCAYLLNLASPDELIWQRSVEGMQREVERAALLSIRHVVLHPGSHIGSGVMRGIQRIAHAVNQIQADQTTLNPVILLECMAGQGQTIGSRFEELAEILALIQDKSRIGICLDTCHLFAAGYDIRTKESFSKVLTEFDKTVGLTWIKAFHLNDSKKELGSHVDRHEHIGQGAIGLEAFSYLLNEPRFAHIPMVLETPKGPDDTFDLENLSILRSLC